MYWDVTDLHEFYGTGIGRIARKLLRERLQYFWPNVTGQCVAALGYATPYLRPFEADARTTLVLMPQQQGVRPWPPEQNNIALLCDETALPLPDDIVDKFLLVHCLEHAEHKQQLLDEVWRCLTPQGRGLIVVPNRHGLWSRAEHAPFGHGQAFAMGELKRLLRRSGFVLERSEPCLFTPPLMLPIALRPLAHLLERGARKLHFAFGGVLIVEVSKQIYAPIAQGQRRKHKWQMTPQKIGAEAGAIQRKWQSL